VLRKKGVEQNAAVGKSQERNVKRRLLTSEHFEVSSMEGFGSKRGGNERRDQKGGLVPLEKGIEILFPWGMFSRCEVKNHRPLKMRRKIGHWAASGGGETVGGRDGPSQDMKMSRYSKSSAAATKKLEVLRRAFVQEKKRFKKRKSHQ